MFHFSCMQLHDQMIIPLDKRKTCGNMNDNKYLEVLLYVLIVDSTVDAVVGGLTGGGSGGGGNWR